MSAFIPEIAARALMPRELLAEASGLHLCLHLSPHLLCANLAEASSLKIIWNQTFEIENIAGEKYRAAIQFLLERNWTEKVFRKCTLSFDTPHFCLVPTPFYNREKQQELLEFHTGTKHSAVAHIAISEMNAELIFEQIPSYSEITKKYPNVRIFPAAALLARFSMANSAAESNSISLLLHGDMLVLCVLKNKLIQLLNAFPAKSDDDVLYYSAHAAMQLGIELEHTHIKIYSFENQTTLCALLKNYCRNVHQDNSKAAAINYMHLVCA